MYHIDDEPYDVGSGQSSSEWFSCTMQTVLYLEYRLLQNYDQLGTREENFSEVSGIS